jgi:hypothetical protein
VDREEFPRRRRALLLLPIGSEGVLVDSEVFAWLCHVVFGTANAVTLLRLLIVLELIGRIFEKMACVVIS